MCCGTLHRLAEGRCKVNNIQQANTIVQTHLAEGKSKEKSPRILTAREKDNMGDMRQTWGKQEANKRWIWGKHEATMRPPKIEYVKYSYAKNKQISTQTLQWRRMNKRNKRKIRVIRLSPDKWLLTIFLAVLDNVTGKTRGSLGRTIGAT